MSASSDQAPTSNDPSTGSNASMMETSPGGESTQYPPHDTDFTKSADTEKGQLGGESNDDDEKAKKTAATGTDVTNPDQVGKGIGSEAENTDQLSTREKQGYGSGSGVGA